MHLQKLIKIKHLLLLILTMLLIVSCQKEYETIVEPDPETAITENDQLADLILKVALKDGSFDNIIDKCSQVNIQFPYAVQVKDELINISSREDIEAFKYTHFANRKQVIIKYPITVSYSDFSETILENEGQLRKIQEKYNANLKDDDIECIDFEYPIKLSVYDKRFQKNRGVVARKDVDLYAVFSKLSEQIVQVNYPITLNTLTGEVLTIKNNQELKKQIINANVDCDENDEPELDDDDHPFASLILGSWNIDLLSDTENRTEAVSDYRLVFKGNHELEAKYKNINVEGSWELAVGEERNTLNIDLETEEGPLDGLNEEWIIVDNSPTKVEFQVEKDDGIIKKLTLVKPE